MNESAISSHSFSAPPQQESRSQNGLLYSSPHHFTGGMHNPGHQPSVYQSTPDRSDRRTYQSPDRSTNHSPDRSANHQPDRSANHQPDDYAYQSPDRLTYHRPVQTNLLPPNQGLTQSTPNLSQTNQSGPLYLSQTDQSGPLSYPPSPDHLSVSANYGPSSMPTQQYTAAPSNQYAPYTCVSGSFSQGNAAGLPDYRLSAPSSPYRDFSSPSHHPPTSTAPGAGLVGAAADSQYNSRPQATGQYGHYGNYGSHVGGGDASIVGLNRSGFSSGSVGRGEFSPDRRALYSDRGGLSPDGGRLSPDRGGLSPGKGSLSPGKDAWKTQDSVAGQSELPLEVSYFPTFMSPTPRAFVGESGKNGWKEPTVPSEGYPTSHRDDIMGALKTLSGRIRGLESKRNHAEESLRSLSEETSHYQEALDRSAEKEPEQTQVSKHSQELQAQLASAETRCRLLDRQLDYMRQMVSEVQTEKKEAVERTTAVQWEREREAESELRRKRDKLEELERERLQLAAGQSLAEDKIRELEGRLESERIYKARIQDKAAQFESVAEANRILLGAVSPRGDVARRGREERPKRRKKKQRCAPAATTQCTKSSVGGRGRQRGGEHYRLQFDDIPFVVGQSIAPSHRLGANVQKVISLMKSHNPRLCPTPPTASCPVPEKNVLRSPRSNAAAARKTPRFSASLPVQRSAITTETGSGESSSGQGGEDAAAEGLEDLMDQLREEFSAMAFEHQEIRRELEVTSPSRATNGEKCERMERELEKVVGRMEAKGEQIRRVREHQTRAQQYARSQRKREKQRQRQHDQSRRATSLSRGRPEPRSQSSACVAARSGTKRQGAAALSAKEKSRGRRERECPTSPRAKAAAVFKDVKRLQTSLKPGDLEWK